MIRTLQRPGGTSTVGELINPTRQKPSKDFAAANRARIAEIADTAAAAKEYMEIADHVEHERMNSKLKRFQNVPARVVIPPADAENVPPSRSSRAAKAAPAPAPEPFVRPAVAPRKPAVPSVAEARKQLVHAEDRPMRDFIRENARTAPAGEEEAECPASPGDLRGTMAKTRAAGGKKAFVSACGTTAIFGSSGGSSGSSPHRHEEFGAVPKYLQDRQKQWALEAEERKKKEAEKDIPAGMRLMPEQERQETLAMLEKSIQEARDELGRFKLRLTVPSQIQRKAAVEDKIVQLEKAVGVFSRPKVFVKIDG